MAVPPPSSKPALRRALRLARERFDGDPTAIAKSLLPLMADATVVGGYVAHRGEPDVSAALLDGLARGVAVALPQVTGPGTMRFLAWRAGDPLAPGRVGVPEPTSAVEAMPDMLLVPLLGFDRAGRRLGQGGGYYDRWLAGHPDVRRIGVAWSVQEVGAVPEDGWDARLDAIVTERGVIVP